MFRYQTSINVKQCEEQIINMKQTTVKLTIFYSHYLTKYIFLLDWMRYEIVYSWLYLSRSHHWLLKRNKSVFGRSEYGCFHTWVLFKRTEPRPLYVDQEVDQVKRDPAFFVSTLSQFLKEDPDPFLVHLRQSVSSNSLSYRNLSGFTVYWIPFQSDLSNSEIDIKTLQSLFILKANVIIKLDGHFHCRQILVMFYYEQTRANHFITCSSSAESAHVKQTAINQQCFI